jgi:hypothetical protein
VPGSFGDVGQQTSAPSKLGNGQSDHEQHAVPGNFSAGELGDRFSEIVSNVRIWIRIPTGRSFLEHARIRC